MNENQVDLFIYSHLKHLGNKKFRAYYKGTHASDELEKLHIKHFNKPLCFAFILNTLERKNSNAMGHWLSLHISIKPEFRMVNVKFLDSFRNPYHAYGENITKYIDRLRIKAINEGFSFKIENVPFILQSYGSKICGGYCCYGVIKLRNCGENNLYSIFSKFDESGRKLNDILMGEFIARNWPQKSCTDMISNRGGIPFCPKKVYDHIRCLPKCECKHKSCKNPKSSQYIRRAINNLFI